MNDQLCPHQTIAYFHCTEEELAPLDGATKLVGGLVACGADFQVYEDLCLLACRNGEQLRQIASAASPLCVVSPYTPRAARSLFHYAGAPLPADVTILNIRLQRGEQVLTELFPQGSPTASEADKARARRMIEALTPQEPSWRAWFPVIDYNRCVQCKQCMGFCLFGVYQLDSEGGVVVKNPANCKDNCPACARVCPNGAIIFPKFPQSPINGDDAGDDADQAAGIDLGDLLRGDVMQALRRRAATPGGQSTAEAEKRFADLLNPVRQTQADHDGAAGPARGDAQ